MLNAAYKIIAQCANATKTMKEIHFLDAIRKVCICLQRFIGPVNGDSSLRSLLILKNRYRYLVTPMEQPPAEPCNPTPCGANAVCKERNGAGSCTCLPDYQGDPYLGCRPECVQNSDCLHNRACINNKCKDPCTGACGLNAQCQVYNHQPSCTCISGYTGNPLTSCHIPPQRELRFILSLLLFLFYN